MALPEPLAPDYRGPYDDQRERQSFEERLVRIESKLDHFAAMLERFAPLLELAERRAARSGRWFGGASDARSQ